MLDKQQVRKLNMGHASLREICVNNDINYHRAYYWCKKRNVSLSRKHNGKSKATLCARKRSRIFNETQKNQLLKLYIHDNKSVHDIATKFSTSGATVAAALRRMDIPVKLTNGKYEKRTPKYDKKTLVDLYEKQELSCHEISCLLDYKHHGEVVEDLKFYNINRRSYKEAGKLLYKKHPEKRDLHRKQFYAGITGPRTNEITSLEKTFINWAEHNNIPFTFQFQIRKNWHRYDFLINDTNIIVEMDGDFWHSLPEHVERDKKFDETALRYGYEVIRIKESTVKSNPSTLDEQLLPLLKEKICKKEPE